MTILLNLVYYFLINRHTESQLPNMWIEPLFLGYRVHTHARMHAHTHTTHTHTHTHTHTQTDRQKDRQLDSYADRHTDKHKYSIVAVDRPQLYLCVLGKKNKVHRV